MGLFGDVLSGVGGLVGSFEGGGDRDEAMRNLERARQEYGNLNPNIKAQQAPRSGLLAADPATRAAQLEALGQFQNQYREGGLTAIDRAKLGDISDQTERTARTAQAGIMNDAARRGAATSGNTLVAQQVASQNASNRATQDARQVGALSLAGRMAAVQGAAGVAGGMREQDYQRAAAQDAIERFNAANRQNAQQQTYQNSLDRAHGIAGQYNRQAGQKNDDATWTQRRWEGLGRTIGSAGDAAAAGIAGGAGGGGIDTSGILAAGGPVMDAGLGI